jgi:EH domain-containing protein 1
MYRENYITSLRTELLERVEEYLTPAAIRYGYSEVPLEANIKWRPQVLVLGNYSSGKSTLINEFLGAQIQATGQAPTDDSFTIITFDDAVTDGPIRVTEQRDGKFLLNSPEYPFETLKKHGQRFAAHFRLKKVNSPFLKNLAIIDTPGMLDSVSERDRGYNYQEVIGDFAQIADLVLVLFDPHKAGTVREAHTSLRDTLPARTFEDRLVLVLNRIDECASLMDLLQVYGTLCWNLSQMTGRKDIPPIHLTYSPIAAGKSESNRERDMFLQLLDNRREVLKQAIQEAPKHRLDHLATFVETHSERLSHFLEGLISYRKRLIFARIKWWVTGLVTGAIISAGSMLGLLFAGIMPGLDPGSLALLGGAGTAIFMLLWGLLVVRNLERRFHARTRKNLDELTSLDTQTRRDNWEAVKGSVLAYLKKTDGGYSLLEVRADYDAVKMVQQKGTREIREALDELTSGRMDAEPPNPTSSGSTVTLRPDGYQDLV